MASPQQSTLECPYCRLAITSEATNVCPGCGTSHHTRCWEELGGCAVDGCPNMVETKSPDATATYWGATKKKCPWCAEEIAVSETKCPKCNATFEDMRPVAVQEVLPQLPDPVIADYRRTAKWLLVFSLLVFTSPFALLFGGIWYRSNRAQIERADPTVRALALVSFGICVLYLVMGGLGTLAFYFSRHRVP